MWGPHGDGFTLRFFNLYISLLLSYIFSNLIYVLLLFIIFMSMVYLGGEIMGILLFVFWHFSAQISLPLFCLSVVSLSVCLSTYLPSSLLPVSLYPYSSNMSIVSYLKPL